MTTTMIDRLQTRLKADPKDIEGWVLLARTHMNQDNYAEGGEAFKKALDLEYQPELAADYAEALTLVAEAVTPEALEVLLESRRRDPFNPKARFYIGLQMAETGDIRAAAQEWVDLVAVSPKNAPWLEVVFGQLAEALDSLGLKPGDIPPSVEAQALARTFVEASGQSAEPVLPSGPSGPQSRPDSAPGSANAPPGPSRADVKAAAGMAAGDRDALIRSMVQRLADRLAESPADPAGWQRLARAYEVLGEAEKAAEARRNAEKYK